MVVLPVDNMEDGPTPEKTQHDLATGLAYSVPKESMAGLAVSPSTSRWHSA
jgi:hypothetical protein